MRRENSNIQIFPERNYQEVPHDYLDMDGDNEEEQQLIGVSVSQEIGNMVDKANNDEQSGLKDNCVEETSTSKTKSLQTPLMQKLPTTTAPSILAAVAALGLPATLARDMVAANGDANAVKNTIVNTITVGGADNDSNDSSTNQIALTNIIPSNARRFILQSSVNQNGTCEEDKRVSLAGESYGEINYEGNTTKIVINEQVVSDAIHQGEDTGENSNVNDTRSGCALEKQRGDEEHLVVTLAGAGNDRTLVSASDTCEFSSRKHQINDISYRSQEEQGSSSHLISVNIEEQKAHEPEDPRSAVTKDSSLLQFADNQTATAEETPYTATSIINNNNNKRKQSDSLPNENIDTNDLKNKEQIKGISLNATPADSQSQNYNSDPEDNNSDVEDDSLGITTEDNTITVTVGGPPGSPSNMIDASDFRMGAAGGGASEYATLASMNGRMTPPPPGHGGHPTHHVHGYHVNSSYATLTPLQPLPPISTLSSMQDKFQAYSPNGGSSHPSQGPGGFGSGGMQNNTLSNISLGSPYNTYDKLPMGISPPPYGGHNAGHNALMGGNNGQHDSHSPSSSALSPHEGPNENYSSHNIGLNAKQEPMSPNSAGYYESNPIVHSNNTNNKHHQSSPGGNHHELSPHSSSHGLDHSPTSGTNSTGGHNGHHGSMHVPTSIYGSGGEPLTSTNNPSLNGMASISPQTISPVPHTSPGQLLPIHHPHELSPTSPTGINHGSSGGASILAAAAAVAASNASKPPPSLHPNPHHVLAHQLGVVQGGHPGNMSQLQHNMVSLKSSNTNPPNSGHNGSGGETEEINTKDLAQRISAELKRYSIPQAIFAQRVLCRSQGTLSDLLRNPKPWSKLKSGRETFRRMQKWLSEPEFQRMSSLRLAGNELFEIYYSLGKRFFYIFMSCL